MKSLITSLLIIVIIFCALVVGYNLMMSGNVASALYSTMTQAANAAANATEHAASLLK